MKPGILVDLGTTVTGGVHYQREEIDEHVEEDGTEVVEWNTKRMMEDAEEHREAARLRSQIVRLFYAICTKTGRGALLCPDSREDELNEAIGKAHEIADEFNAKASYTFVDFDIFKGRISETDEENTRALANQIKRMLDDIDEGVRGCDPKLIRDARNRAKKISQMIDNGQARRVTAAAEAATEAANQIAKRVIREGENGEKVIADLKLDAIRKARFSFLDTGKAINVKRLPKVRAQRFADLKTATKTKEMK
jgi:hypothetical protein